MIQFPIAECDPLLDCNRCLGNDNPVCGWCVLENKCSRISECKTSDDSAGWIQAATTNVDRCLTITVSPEQYAVDIPQTVMQGSCTCMPLTFHYSDQITITVSQELPMLQEDDMYSCHFAGNEEPFTVPANGSGSTYMCDITGRIPTEYEGLATGCPILAYFTT